MSIDAQMAESGAETLAVDGESTGRIVWKRFTRHRVAMGAAVVLALSVLLAVTSIGVGPISGWWKWGPNDIDRNISRERGAPTMGWYDGSWHFGEHPFGQDTIGQDIFARTMQGAQTSLSIMVLMGVFSTFLGVLIGALAGYYRGRSDNVLMRLTEVFLVIPTIAITAVLGRLTGKSAPWVFGLALGFLLWVGLARLVRAEFLSLREREFVDAARVAGASDARIMFKHMLPNAMGVIIVNATLLMAVATILEASLSFIGFGIQFPYVSLGSMINEYQAAFATRPWLFWWPGLFIIVFALTINLIGDGLRDAFDPRQKRIPKGRDFHQERKADA